MPTTGCVVAQLTCCNDFLQQVCVLTTYAFLRNVKKKAWLKSDLLPLYTNVFDYNYNYFVIS